MLDSFSVQGFRGFAKRTEIRFDRPRHYDFNEGLIKDGRVNHALLYGPNGCGKSSLTEAIIDIQVNRNLVRGKISLPPGNPLSFLNGDGAKEAVFRYEFSFGEGKRLVYEYGKPSPFEVSWEKMEVNGEVVLDKRGASVECSIPGTENINFQAISPQASAFFSLANFLSFPHDSLYGQLVDFVDRMLLLRPLPNEEESRPRLEDMADEIAREGIIKELKEFLRGKAGITLPLEEGPARNLSGRKLRTVAARFKGRSIDLTAIASTGTKALIAFFYWKKRSPDLSFLLVDGFDAPCHYAVAREIVGLINEPKKFQSLLTTHNTDLMSNLIARPDCIFLMDCEKVEALSELTGKEIREVHNLAKIYKGGGFRISNGDAIE